MPPREPINALYDSDDPFGYGQDERLRRTMTHAAPDEARAKQIAKTKALVEILPPIKQIKGLWNALTQPFTAEESSGISDVSRDALIRRAVDLQMAQLTGAAFVRPKGASAGVFAGPGAKTADQDALREARALHYRHGAPMEDVWRKTGWFKGADEKWRFEIPDTGASLMADISNVPLGAVFEHPELYRAYPQLAESRFNMLPGTSFAKGQAARDKNTGKFEISLRKDALDDPTIMLHELQHPIQRIEGFSMGGSPTAGKSPFMDDLAKLDAAHAAALKRVETMPLSDPNFQANIANLDKIRKQNEIARATHFKYEKARQQAAYDNYSKIAGEVEARNVETRWKMDQDFADPYNRIYPRSTEDIPANQQIIALGSDRQVGPRVQLGPRNMLINPRYERY